MQPADPPGHTVFGVASEHQHVNPPVASLAPDGGGFNPPTPTRRGGPDYGRFVEAVRTLQDYTRGADAPDDVVTEVAEVHREAGLRPP